MGNADHVGPREFTEKAGTLYLGPQDLGVDPEGPYGRFYFQFIDLAGGNVELAFKGPAGIYVTAASGQEEGDLVDFVAPASFFKFTFAGTGGVGKVFVTAYRTN